MFKGRIEELQAIIDKKTEGGMVFQISGRSDFSVLVDAICSQHAVQQTGSQIVTNTYQLQNSLALPLDPVLSIGNVEADNTNLLNFLWKRNSLQEMLRNVSQKLGAPSSQGGINQFYDFWVNPSDAFYFMPCAALSSNVNLGYPTAAPNLEIQEGAFVTDANPVKNDIWIWGTNTAAGAGLGRIPLSMQPNFPGNKYDPNPYPKDTWTEGTASLYGNSAPNRITISNNSLPMNVAVGQASIKISYIKDPIAGVIVTGPNVYWYMQFGTGSSPNFNTLWPAQLPYSCMNTYNETGVMVEQMGQMSALVFFIKGATNDYSPSGSLNLLSFTFVVEVQDFFGNIADSPVQTYNGVSNPSLNDFQVVAIPFGPESNYTLISSTSSPAYFDWASVQQIRFIPTVSQLGVSSFYVWFDGFQIVKPLVVNCADPSAPSRRSIPMNKSGILTYSDAVNYGEAQLETLRQPQVYYSIKNIGRNDIFGGYTVQAYGQTLIARELSYKFNKASDGWLIDLKGWQAT
jgi:hypothetical protein